MWNDLPVLGCQPIAVIGDVMLDCYLTGEVTRISPEAPVPVLRVVSEREVPGGAANVAANLASLGLHVNLVGIVGEDQARDHLTALLTKAGDIDCSRLVTALGRRTTRKLRIIGAHQQIVRVDHEDPAPCTGATEVNFIAAAIAAVDSSCAVVLSDYGKGAFTDTALVAIIDHARRSDIPLVVDPKRTDLSVFRGARIVTPNRKELSEATRLPCETDEEAALAAARAQEMCGADILLTRSEKGMSFFPVDGAPIHLPTAAQDVFDVSGAGDTVVAVLIAALASKLPITEAMRLANHAAGIVVSKLGTACVTRDELAASLMASTDVSSSDGQCLDRHALAAIRARWQRDKLIVGFANGCFDLIHPGHISLIRQAAESCDRLIVAINSDSSVKRLKGPTRPFQNEAARAEVIGAIKGVAAVVVFDEATPLELIQLLEPDVLVKGADYTIDSVVGADIVKARGGRILLAPLSIGHSTTRIAQQLKAAIKPVNYSSDTPNSSNAEMM